MRLGGRSVVIEVAGGSTLKWRRRRIRGAELVAPDGTALLSCDGEPGRLHVADPALLQALRPARRDLSLTMLAVALLGMGGAVVAGGAPILSQAAWLIPDAVQDRLGAAALTASFGTARRCTGAAGQAALERLASRLATAGGIVGPVSVEVLASSQVNAFALPARRVVVLSGLLWRMQDGDEFAGVFGHELGHVLARDPMVGFLRGNLLLAAGELGGAGSAMSAAPLLTLTYSRAAEARADATSLRLLQAAGMRSDGLARALARLDRAGEDAQPAWLSDHPLTPARIAASAGSPLGALPLSDAEWAAIRDMCRTP